MLSKDPIFDCTLSLKSSFSDFTSTWPPPGREEHEQGRLLCQPGQAGDNVLRSELPLQGGSTKALLRLSRG